MAVEFRFTKDYDHKINSYTDKAYKAGQQLVIPNAHAAGAEAAGAGEPVGPSRTDDGEGGETA